MSRKAADALARAHPGFAPLVRRHGAIELEPSGLDPYAALSRHIVFQQLSGKAAETIYSRFAALYGGDGAPPPETLAAEDPERLRSAGLSRNKARALIDLARKTADGEAPDAEACRGLDDDAVVERLTRVRGVGVWTAQMYLISGLGRPDVWPIGDLGVRRGWRVMAGLDETPSPAALEANGKSLRPYRSCAALYLWRAADEGATQA